MKREIKFRAYRKNKRMNVISLWLDGKGNVKHIFGEVLVGENQTWFDNFELMQYTGLKDKNGKEIYEGDILETNSQDVQHLDKKWRRIYVDFDNAHFRFNAVGQEGKEYNLLYRLETWKPKVIGNIYMNPELLKEVLMTTSKKI